MLLHALFIPRNSCEVLLILLSFASQDHTSEAIPSCWLERRPGKGGIASAFFPASLVFQSYSRHPGPPKQVFGCHRPQGFMWKKAGHPAWFLNIFPNIFPSTRGPKGLNSRFSEISGLKMSGEGGWSLQQIQHDNFTEWLGENISEMVESRAVAGKRKWGKTIENL